VDVKAQDSHERIYQIEIQLTSYSHLPARIIYNWADIYSQQLKSGQDYGELKPTYAIWLLAENLITTERAGVCNPVSNVSGLRTVRSKRSGRVE
jgi:predicted transposase/invertase (TIGR01784 family)